MSFNSVNFSNSNNECYEAELARRCAEAETLLWQQEEKEHIEYQAQKEMKLAKQRRLEKEACKKEKEKELWRKAKKEARSREEEHQRELTHHLEANYIAAVKKQCCKNWTKTFLSPTTSPSDKEMNLINLLPLTKRQHVQYLPQETLEAHQWREELAREMGTSVVGEGSLCERYTDFGILYISQNLPWVFV